MCLSTWNVEEVQVGRGLWSLGINGRLVSGVVITIRGMKTVFPPPGPVSISASITVLPNWVTINLVPLHSPSTWSRFRTSMMGTPSFSVSLWLEIPDSPCLLRNSLP